MGDSDEARIEDGGLRIESQWRDEPAFAVIGEKSSPSGELSANGLTRALPPTRPLGLPIHVARLPAAPFTRATRSPVRLTDPELKCFQTSKSETFVQQAIALPT